MTMTAFEIIYLEDDGALACAFTVQFESEMRAKILAHAMKPADCRTIEIWRGKALIYRRPEAEPKDGIDERFATAHSRRNLHRQQPSFA
jgi:hypothetical protein